MSRTFEQVKNDPLYRQWCEADTIHRAVVKRFCFDFKTKLDDAKLQIESELRERYRDEISLSSSSVKSAFDSYCQVFGEHPPNNEQQGQFR